MILDNIPVPFESFTAVHANKLVVFPCPNCPALLYPTAYKFPLVDKIYSEALKVVPEL